MDILKDKKMMQELDLLRNENEIDYFNIKKLISFIYRMFLYNKAEEEFLSRFTYCFKCYRVDSKYKYDFLSYCEINSKAKRIYLYLKNTENFAMIFCVDDNGYIVDKKPIYNTDAINDILYTFEQQLTLCAPEEIH